MFRAIVLVVVIIGLSEQAPLISDAVDDTASSSSVTDVANDAGTTSLLAMSNGHDPTTSAQVTRIKRKVGFTDVADLIQKRQLNTVYFSRANDIDEGYLLKELLKANRIPADLRSQLVIQYADKHNAFVTAKRSSGLSGGVNVSY